MPLTHVHRREREERRLGKEDKTYPKARRPKESTKHEVGRRRLRETQAGRISRLEMYSGFDMDLIGFVKFFWGP